MRLIHPKKYWRVAKKAWNSWRFKRQAKACGVIIEIGEGVQVEGCRISISKFYANSINKRLAIGDNCDLRYATFFFHGSNSAIVLGAGTEINGSRDCETVLQVDGNTKIEIGEDCLFSDGIKVSTTDYHSILKADGEIINPAKDVRIGKHVWIGQKAYIGKGVEIGDHMVVGGFSVVTKSYKQGHCVVAGNPAAIRKEDIDWRP